MSKLGRGVCDEFQQVKQILMGARIKILFLLLTFLTLSVPVTFAQNQSKKWVEAKNINANFKAVSSQPEIEVFSAPNIIMVKVNKETEIRLFTILGKLISTQKLEPGIFEFHLDSHGIYIIKTETSSSKIAI